MPLVININEFSGPLSADAPPSEALELHRWLEDLPPALKTPNNLELIKIYYLIPRTGARRFVQVLLARMAGVAETFNTVGDLSEVEYLLAHYSQLPTDDMRDKMLTLVRQVCAANGGDLGYAYEAAPRSSNGDG